MCGIAGFTGRRAYSAQEFARIAETMAATMRDRGPDDAGVWTDPSAGVALAHRRLAVVDLSPAGHQPMTSSCGRLVLTYNGEIYNHAELREELRAAGRTFRGHSDTEVLVEACAEWGIERTLRKLWGMFAFALWDRSTRTLTLARDRLGKKPLFWGRFGGLFLFASELKALRAHPGWTPEIDPESLSAYMRWGHVPAPYSIYQGVHKLLPGELLELGPAGEPKTSSYWDPARVAAAAQSDPLEIDEPEALEWLAELLDDAVARRMVADVPLGAFLSGGIDSSLVVGMMQRRSTRPVHTFTVAFEEKRYDESTYARAVAKHLGTDHSEVMVTSRDAQDLVPELPVRFDEPLAIRSQIPVMLLCRLARRDVTVALSGDGGDELFGGYPGYFIVRAVDRATGGWSPAMRRLFADGVDGLIGGAAAIQRLLPVSRRPGLWANRVKQVTGVVRAGGGIPELYGELYRSTAGPSPLLGAPDEHPMRWQAPEHRDVVRDPIDRMGYFALLGTLIDGTLAKVDRASMAYSLEVRVPFLDHRVVEYAWRLPPALKYGKRAGSKHLLRKLLDRYVPPELVDRPKRGFSSPLPEWLRGPLRPWAEDLLDERELKAEGLFDATAVRACWNEHLCHTGDYWQLLWNVLMFRQWRSHWDASSDRHSALAPLA
ncbi:MAG TPA: asparagine synthase (glutamine-hydrolyzing) [Myxococcota bacterium]|nr:asparagine synthase (glutamine-hydrolyzing) [Myxococcota bacterium]